MMNQAVMAMSSRRISDIVVQWYGNNWDYPTRQEIRRLLNSVKGTLNSADYVYPGDQCTPQTYAYVYPNAPWNINYRGQFVFHLCDLFLKVGDDAQIETLVHEGSRHIGSRTDDATWDGVTMYGRPLCKQVAVRCGQGDQQACSKARKNADTFAYFVNDAAKAATTRGIEPLGRRRRSDYTPRRRRSSSPDAASRQRNIATKVANWINSWWPK